MVERKRSHGNFAGLAFRRFVWVILGSGDGLDSTRRMFRKFVGVGQEGLCLE